MIISYISVMNLTCLLLTWAYTSPFLHLFLDQPSY